MKPGRPRIANSQAVRQILIDLVREGVRTFTVPLLVSTLSSRLAMSRATAYRALRRAHEEGTIRIPPFETPGRF
jgi:DNA-binding transcriptional regulator LsrR (DeoR family)